MQAHYVVYAVEFAPAAPGERATIHAYTEEGDVVNLYLKSGAEYQLGKAITNRLVAVHNETALATPREETR